MDRIGGGGGQPPVNNNNEATQDSGNPERGRGRGRSRGRSRSSRIPVPEHHGVLLGVSLPQRSVSPSSSPVLNQSFVSHFFPALETTPSVPPPSPSVVPWLQGQGLNVNQNSPWKDVDKQGTKKQDQQDQGFQLKDVVQNLKNLALVRGADQEYSPSPNTKEKLEGEWHCALAKVARARIELNCALIHHSPWKIREAKASLQKAKTECAEAKGKYDEATGRYN